MPTTRIPGNTTPFAATPNHTITWLTHPDGCEHCAHAVQGAVLGLALHPDRERNHHVVGSWAKDTHTAHVRRELPAPWTPATSELAQRLRATEPLTPPRVTMSHEDCELCQEVLSDHMHELPNGDLLGAMQFPDDGFSFHKVTIDRTSNQEARP